MAEVAYNSLKTQSSRARPSDSDNDGLYHWEEVNRRNTDPFNPDSDSDGLTDGAEIFQYFTNPNNPDSDGDGLSDGDEALNLQTDPTSKKTSAPKINNFLILN